MKKTLIYSIQIQGTDLWLGLWAGKDYMPQSAISKAAGRIELRVMELAEGGLLQRKIWPRRTLFADQAILFADEVKNQYFDNFTFDSFKGYCEQQVRNWYFGAHA